MYLAEARSHSDGIEFFINDKNIIINAKRNQNGEIIITKELEPRIIKKDRTMIIIPMCVSIIGSIVLYYCETIDNYKLNIISFLVLAWLTVLGYYFIRSKSKNNISTFKYHAAEHKVLNYWDKHKEIPPDCESIMEMDSISWRCGSTVIAVLLVLSTQVTIGILFIPFLILKIMWCAISVCITFFLWAIGELNFLQKFVIKEPDYEQVELAFYGFKAYSEEKKS